MKNQREWIYSIDEINDIASEFFEIYKNERIFCFNGVLGSGKTSFVKALCKQLGCNDEITSPTFSIINQYSGSNSEIFHFDLYRLNNIEEILDTGAEEYIYSGNYCFIEWYDKIINILPHQNVVYCEIRLLNINKRRLISKIN